MKQKIKIDCIIEFDPDKPLSKQLNYDEIKDIIFESILATGNSYNLILKLLEHNNPDLILHLVQKGVDSVLNDLNNKMDNFVIEERNENNKNK